MRAPHYPHLSCPLGVKGSLKSQICATFGTVTDVLRNDARYHTISITKYSQRFEKARDNEGIRLFISQWEDLMTFHAAISKSLEATALGADMTFVIKHGSGIKTFIDDTTGHLRIQHYRGRGRREYETEDIGIRLDKSEWQSLLENKKVLYEKIQLHQSDSVTAPLEDQYNEHLHRTVV